MANPLLKRRERIKKRVRASLNGTADRPRISVYRSTKHIYAQAIDDATSVTIASASDKSLKGTDKMTKTQIAAKVGELLGQSLVKLGCKKALFDRGHYQYMGRVQTLADGVRSTSITI